MKLRVSAILFMSVAIGCGFVLFQTSQNVQQAESKLRNIKATLNKEKEAIRVLEAEWDYLNRPDRIEDLARQHLKMTAPDPKSLVRDSGDVPDTTLPIPNRKPSHIREATVKAAAPATVPPPQPAGSDMPQNSRQNFNDLLDTITRQEPASGGAE